MQLTRRELIDLAKQLKHKGGVGPKYIKLSKSEDDSVYKILALGRYPRLSLAVYLIMGWSVLFVAPQVMSRISTLVVVFLLAEGLFYTSGTWFFAHDSHPRYHAVWHVFVLLGAMAHTGAVLCLLFPAG